MTRRWPFRDMHDSKKQHVIVTPFHLSIVSLYQSMNQQSSAEIMFLSNASDSDITNFSTKYDSCCIFVLIVSIIGVVGNSFTIFAFQYAKLKKKYQFHRSWRQVTIFIWNLSLVDLLSSLNMTVLYVQFTFYPNSINNWFLCVSQITIRDIFILISAS